MSGNKLTRLHVHADGLIVSKSDTGDDQPVKLTLASAETQVTEGEVVGQIDFKSADGGASGDGIVCASIQAEALGAFDGTTDPAKLSFLTRNSGASTERMVITPQGVGIGTTDVDASVDLAIGDSDTGLKQEGVGVGELALIANGNEGIRVTENGVGIKTQLIGTDLDLAIGDSTTGLSGSGAGLALRTANQERMRVTDSGVGINTTNVHNTVDLAIGHLGTGIKSENVAGQQHLSVVTDMAERMRVTNNGVGIKTTSVAANLDLAIGDSDTGFKSHDVTIDGSINTFLAVNTNGDERMRVTNNGVGVNTQVVHESVDLAIGDSDTGFKTGTVGDQQYLAVITNTAERLRVTNDGLNIGTAVPSSNIKLQIKSDPADLVGTTNFASQNGFGQFHIETHTQRRDGVGTEVGTSKLKIGIEQSNTNVEPKAYLQCVCDNISKGQLLLNPDAGNEGGVGIKTTSVASSVDLAIGDSDTGLKQQGDGVLTVVADNVERMRIDSNGLQVTKSGHIADFQGSGTDSGHYIGVSNSIEPTSENRTVAYFGIGGAGFAGEAGDTVISNYRYGDSVQKRIVFDQTGTTRMIIDSTGGVGIRTNTVSSTVDLAVGDSDTGLKQKGDGVLALMTDNNERMRVTNSGIMIGSEDTPLGKLDVRGVIRVQNGTSDTDFFRAYTNDTGLTGRFFFRWGQLGGDSSTGDYNVHVIMLKNSQEASVGFFENNNNEGSFDFTGQHRSIMNTNYENDVLGLIASATGQLINLDNGTRATVNESLPYCILANSDNDKKVYGVISQKEDGGAQRGYGSGFVATMDKANDNEQRMYINAVGEGGIWVCSKNGAIENGDYVTSSSVVGYGMKQVLNEGLLGNYTVAKLTQDCQFSLTRVVKQKLKVIVGTDSDGNTTSSIDYDADGNVLYEDDLDSESNQQMVYPLDTRFLMADGTQLIDEADYTTRLGNGEEVFIACFVGCTYHCG